MSTNNAEPFKNLPDSVTIPAEDPSNWGGEPSTGIASTEGRVREARSRLRNLQKRLQACTDRLLGFETEEEILVFEENEVKNLDWEVRDLLKTAQELKETKQPLGPEERVGAEFKSLVRHCCHLSDRFGSTGDPTFASLLEFVECEEDNKSSDFGVQLMADEKSVRTSKFSAKSSGNPSFNVKKTAAQFDSNGRRNNDENFQNGNMIPATAKPFSDSKNNDLVSVASQFRMCNGKIG